MIIGLPMALSNDIWRPRGGVEFVTPTLDTYHYYCYSYTSQVLWDMRNNVTGGSPCTVQFQIRKTVGKDTYIYTTGVTSPEQNSPHQTNQVSITNAVHRGYYYDLYWRWWSGAQSAGYVLKASNAIYIPAVGEPDSSG